MVSRSSPLPSRQFQSTLPAGGATPDLDKQSRLRFHFNPRPPRGERLSKYTTQVRRICISIHAPREGRDRVQFPLSFYTPKISIHAPREGSDGIESRDDGDGTKFQSTPPARGETRGSPAELHPHKISIHAPREGRDRKRSIRSRLLRISIHAPREGRDIIDPAKKTDFSISIHAPREGRDSCGMA